VLNARAVCERYDDWTPDITYQYRQILSPPDLQVYKALLCWAYQCSEGEIEQMPLFLIFEQISNTLAHGIVARLKAYEEADWG